MKIVGQVGRAAIRVLKLVRWMAIVLFMIFVYYGLWLLPACVLFRLEEIIRWLAGRVVERDNHLVMLFDEWLYSRFSKLERKYGNW